MRVPITWLREYVEFDAAAEALADRLTFAGLEVEHIDVVGRRCEGVVVGEVTEIVPHPDADTLLVCKVSDGAAAVPVVCGARNFAVGDKVPLARPGTVLSNGVKVEETEIRGVRSCGMLCAEDELGISEDHTGLLLLPRDTAAGTPLSAVVGPPEQVLVIEVTPNRADCLSILGVAREVAALFGTALKLPPVDFVESDAAVEQSASVAVNDSRGCPRYTARVLTGVGIRPSPLLLKLRLLQCGIRPISNVVDITNYVLLECGQPLHAFDRRLLGGGKVVVRKARRGEKMTTLDGVDRSLAADMLVIADAERAVAVAGVMGGAGTEIREDTAEVLLESACFAPAGIRRTAKALGLSTESSYRFERGVDVEMVDWASRRAAHLMAAHAGAAVARGVIDCSAKAPKQKRIRCRYGKVRALLGVDVPSAAITGIFEALGLRVLKQAAGSCTVAVPSFRGDLGIEADLIEEVARLHGLDKVPVRAPHGVIVMDGNDRDSRAVRRCKESLAGLGMTEIVNYSFVARGLLSLFGMYDPRDCVVLPNPVSEDQAVMRPSLVPQMVEVLGRNLARQAAAAAMFEVGRVFRRDGSGAPVEEDRIAIGLLGPAGRDRLDSRRPVAPDEAFLWLKGVFEGVAAALGVRGLSFAAHEAAWAEGGYAALISCGSEAGGGSVIGQMGILRRALREEWRMSSPAGVLEVALRPITAHVFDVVNATAVAQYPCVTRDMALIVDARVQHRNVLDIVNRIAPEELTDVHLFDIYTGCGVGAGKKSMAYSFRYRSLARTLTDEEANALHESVKTRIAEELNAEIRESQG